MSLIVKKLSIVASQIGVVPKSSTNKDEKWTFRNIYDIYNHLQPLFKKEGIFLTPNVLESSETVVNTNKGRAFRVKVKVEWTFHAEDGSKLSNIMFGEGLDTSDKATNKAITASLKYLLIYTFLIPTVPTDIDADFNTLTIEPFEPTQQKPPTMGLLQLVESKGMTREDLRQIGIKLGMNPDTDLSAEDRRKLYDYILPRSKDDLL